VARLYSFTPERPKPCGHYCLHRKPESTATGNASLHLIHPTDYQIHSQVKRLQAEAVVAVAKSRVERMILGEEKIG
jgi:hypothetical protein